MIFELKDTAYSVVEGDRIFNVTVVKQGNPGVTIVLTIVNSDITTDGKYTIDTYQNIMRLSNQQLIKLNG